VGLSSVLVAAGRPLVTHPGGHDPTFGHNGHELTDFAGGADSGQAVAIQPDQKIVVGGEAVLATGFGDFGLARYQPDGALDPAFGVGGLVTTDFFGAFDYVESLAIQPDGKILAGGASVQGTQQAPALARYEPDGTLDGSFGTGGKLVWAFATSSRFTSVAIDASGRILAAGYAQSGLFFRPLVVRFLSDGSVDDTFGAGGVWTDHVVGDETLGQLAVQPDGKIVACGTAKDRVFQVIRLDSDGRLDSTFGTSGRVLTPFPRVAWAAADALALALDGTIVVGGGTPTDFALARYEVDGALDTSFGDRGLVTTDFDANRDSLYAIALQPDGKIVAVGSALDTLNNQHFALARYQPDGTLDTGFGRGGRVMDSVLPAFGVYAAVALQLDGKIVAAGSILPSLGITDGDIVVSRYLP
jgi:uncharacterized delta-60 repeat protein